MRLAARPGLLPGFVLFALLGGCGEARKPEAQAPAAAQIAKPSAGYASELANLDAAIAAALALGAQRPDDGLLPLEAVSLYLERARLKGDYEDYRHAQALLDAQPAAKKATAAFCLAQARLHYTLHRLSRASAVLDACPQGTEAAEIAAVRADIAMYSGRYREAEAGYRALVNAFGTPQHYVRMAYFRNKTGSPAEAAALLEAAERRYHGVSATMKSWLKLQRGLVALDRGRFDEALALYKQASDALPGWWLVDEHIAEVTQLLGDARAAKAMYASVVERTQAPEFMDALADLERAEGRASEAAQLATRARALYEARLAAFPEASAGHALDHFLADAADAPRALALAQANFRTRPYGDAAIALARAWLISDKPANAAAQIEAQLAAGWDTAEAWWVLAEALGKQGHEARAAAAKAESLRRNPGSEKLY